MENDMKNEDNAPSPEERRRLHITEIKRNELNFLQKLSFYYPLKFVDGCTTKLEVKDKAIFKKQCNESFEVQIAFNEYSVTWSFPVFGYTTAKQLINSCMGKICAIKEKDITEVPTIILKIIGRDEYIYGENMLAMFEYISESRTKNLALTFVAVPITDVIVPSDEYLRKLTGQTTDNVNHGVNLRNEILLSVKVDKKLTISFGELTNLDPKSEKIRIVGGIFHGKSLLSKISKFKLVKPKNGEDWVIDKIMEFPILIGDLPRMAKLCITIQENAKCEDCTDRQLFRGERYYWKPVAWVNSMLFDSENYLKTSLRLSFWNFDKIPPVDPFEDDYYLQHRDVSFNNVRQENAITLTASIKQPAEKTIMYPNLEELEKFVEDNGEKDLAYDEEKIASTFWKIMMEPGYVPMLDSEKRDLWLERNHLISTSSKLLPKLLRCVQWKNKYRSAEALLFMKNFPTLSPYIALQLLDHDFVDKEVREFAVKCIDTASDEDFLMYLLQLVRYLKYETYFPSDLSNMLLSRATRNEKIGHSLFWHLRSEMSSTTMSIYLGVVLEEYFRRNPNAVLVLSRQKEYVEKLEVVSLFVKLNLDGDNKILNDYMKQRLVDEESLENPLTNPLKTNEELGGLLFEQCHILNSKARPISLVFENTDTSNENTQMIFKSGDDLRQDMLILQLLKVIDEIWKKNGYEMGLTTYECISTSFKYGLIEVVKNAETIGSIQKSHCVIPGTSAFRKQSLYEWIRMHNTSDDDYQQAMENFMNSCAGYCVATFVLGIADRHPDNVMVKTNGQLFHIDFGHILGNFKTKLGFCRERVPFVITNDMVYTICKGRLDEEYKQNRMFEFQSLCEKLYAMIHDNSDLILSLLSTMVTSGLPELSSTDDLHFVYTTLALKRSRCVAKQYFTQKFNEALNSAWKTSLNWTTHNLRRRRSTRYFVLPGEDHDVSTPTGLQSTLQLFVSNSAAALFSCCLPEVEEENEHES